MTDAPDPRPDTTRLPIQLLMSEADFERLTESAMRWGPSWQHHIDDGRFEHSDKEYDVDPKTTWAMAYWIGEHAGDVVLATSYLSAKGHDFELVWDTAENPPGRYSGYLILTDFMLPSWASDKTSETDR